MKFFPVLALTFVLAFGQDTDLDEGIKAFENEFHQLFSDKGEEEKAAAELAKEEAEINENNKAFKEGKSTFFEKLNALSDLPKDEFEKEKLGVIPQTSQGRGLGLIAPPESDRTTSPELLEFYKKMNRASVPSSYDARSLNLVTPPKNQQSCGSCAAFAATSVAETCMLSAGARMNGLDGSEQQLVDCGYDGGSMNGCHGAYPQAYPEWFAKNGGQFYHEIDYPYLDVSPAKKCPSNVKTYNSGAKVDKALVDLRCNEEKMKALVAQYGAVLTAIYASDDSFGNYAGGVYQGCSNKDINHAVTVVGYGTENGKPYWLVKNSWGDSWGDNGYIKIYRGNSQCQIGDYCVVTSCSKTSGNPSNPPVAPPPAPIPVQMQCDVSKMYGPSLSGTFTLTITTGNKQIVSNVSCTNSMCKPQVAGPSNACMYICGKLSC